ncbi:hypothetical protein [Actinomycetospora atypica]|uniref:Uncharacterized protein n=1 Tax=Actinomycetospora atypica TaxID=1290095 RepID=A0ABV9YQM4_9PSEU
MTASSPRRSSGRWWGAAVAACASVAALAGTVAAVATAAGADRDQAERTTASSAPESGPEPALAAEAAAPPVTTRPPAPAARPGRVGDPALGATVALPAGWEAARSQDLVPVPPGRFPTVLTLGERATVLVGRLDPARGSGEDALAAEARRLVGAFADGARGDGDGEVETVSDGAGSLDGRDAFTSVRRISGGAIVRVSTVAGTRGGPGLVVLAVAAPGRTQDADASAADRVVRSLSSAAPDAPPAPGRAGAPPACAAPGAPSRMSPPVPPATGR